MRLVALGFVVACTGDGSKAASRSATGSSGAVASPAATTGSCPRTGHWGDCQIKTRLDQAGLAPQPVQKELESLPALSVKPLQLMTGAAGLAVYFYPDSVARHRDAAKLDTLAYIPQAKPVSMKHEATLIQSDNALAILYSQNEHKRERVSDAITAGPPQP